MKIVRYFFVGGIAAVVDFSIFGISTKLLGFPWFTTAIVSFVIATAVNYLLSIYHVFESGVRFTKQYEVFLVFFVSGIGLIINQIVLWIFIEKFIIDLLVAKIFASGSVFLWNYSARKQFIFKPR